MSAGAAEIVAVGTLFDVRLQPDATVVTVLEGRVTVGLSRSNGKLTPLTLQLGANQQIRVAEGAWPAAPSTSSTRKS